VPRIRDWLNSFSIAPTHFIEPFAGGGIVGLTVAFEELADQVILVELDPQIAAVWQTILQGDGEGLVNKILTFKLTPEKVKEVLAKTDLTIEAQAFQTILKNRVNRGGILAAGAGTVKHGENGKGLASRWYPETLARRIRKIMAIKERITFIEGDGLAVLQQYQRNSEVVFFIDPPYTAGGKKAGNRLYTFFELDHEALFKLSCNLAGDFLMTYSNDQTVQNLAKKHHLTTTAIAMKNTHHAKMTELLRGRDLGWDN
jgi:DNA adenine methylase